MIGPTWKLEVCRLGTIQHSMRTMYEGDVTCMPIPRVGEGIRDWEGGSIGALDLVVSKISYDYESRKILVLAQSPPT